MRSFWIACFVLLLSSFQLIAQEVGIAEIEPVESPTVEVEKTQETNPEIQVENESIELAEEQFIADEQPVEESTTTPEPRVPQNEAVAEFEPASDVAEENQVPQQLDESSPEVVTADQSIEELPATVSQPVELEQDADASEASKVAETETSTTTDLTSGYGKIRLSEAELVRIVSKENGDIKQQEVERLVAAQNIINASSMYDPVIEAGIIYDAKKEKNTVAQSLARSSQTEYEAADNKFYTAISGKTPIGLDYKVYYDMTHERNSLQTDSAYDKEYTASWGVELSQPLLKDRGFTANMANIDLSRDQLRVEEQKLVKSKMLTAYRACSGYVDLQMAQELVKLEEESLALLNRQYELIESLVKGGKRSVTDLYYIESNIARREARLSYARKYLRRASGHIRKMLLGTSAETVDMIEAAESMSELPDQFDREDFTHSLEFENRPEYQQSLIEVNSAKTRLAYARNQDNPSLDLTASFGFTSLDKELEFANENLPGSNYNYQKVGLVFSMPILGKGSESTLAAAKIRLAHSQFSLSNIKSLIKDETIAALSELEHSFWEARNTKDVVTRLSQLVIEDKKQRDQGRKSAIDVLTREIELIQTEVSFLEKRVDYRKAELNLFLAKGIILSVYGVDE